MIRRKRRDVLDDLPPLNDHLEYIELGDEQRAVYDEAESTGVAKLRSETVDTTNILSLIVRLKQICNGVVAGSAKTDWLIDYIVTAMDEDPTEKILVFSQFTETIDHLYSALADRQRWDDARRMPLTLRYVGAMSQAKRSEVVDRFQRDDSDVDVLLVSLGSGSTGLTLTAANHAVMFDQWWNPAVMDQAKARMDRIGQTKEMFVTTLISVDTVEERIQQIIESKRDLFARVVDELTVDGAARALTREELAELFGVKARSGRS